MMSHPMATMKGGIMQANQNWEKELLDKLILFVKKREASAFSEILATSNLNIESTGTGRKRKNKLDFFQMECINMGIYRLISFFIRLQARKTIQGYNAIKHTNQ